VTVSRIPDLSRSPIANGNIKGKLKERGRRIQDEASMHCNLWRSSCRHEKRGCLEWYKVLTPYEYMDASWLYERHSKFPPTEIV
jgi:hypothetical protein